MPTEDNTSSHPHGVGGRTTYLLGCYGRTDRTELSFHQSLTVKILTETSYSWGVHQKMHAQ